MTGTITSRTFTVAFFPEDNNAARATRPTAEQIGGIRKAFSKAEEIEFPITWLIPHQQISPESANRIATMLITMRRISFSHWTAMCITQNM